MGLGYRRAMKPDLNLPGGREHLRMAAGGACVRDVRPAGSACTDLPLPLRIQKWAAGSIRRSMWVARARRWRWQHAPHT
jgi:hypothetical protein